MISRPCEATSARIGKAARFTALGLAALALFATILAPTPAAVAEPPLTVAEAKAQVEALTTEAAALDQKFAGVKEQVKEGKKALADKKADLAEQADKVAEIRAKAGQVALAQYQNRNIDTTAQLFFTEDTDGFLSQVSTVEKIGENQNTVLQSFQQEQANLADLERSAETDLAELNAKKKELKELRKKSDQKVEESEGVLNQLTEEERERLAAEEAKREADAAAAVKDAEDSANRNDSDSQSENNSNDSDSDSDNNGSTTMTAATGSGRGAQALAWAKNQIGKPYAFGSTGPGSFDCSGLTLSAWQSVGVSLSRTSQSQFSDGKAVAKSDLQLGDLVFFYGDLSHVGLYAGNGMLLHASRPGKPVGYIKMDYMPYAGARRPG